MVIKLTDPIHDMCIISHGGNKMGSNQNADFWDDRGTYRKINILCVLPILY
jgi:hypothetical protein